MRIKSTYLIFFTLILTTIISCQNQKSNEPDLKRLDRWLEYYGLSLNHFTDTLMIKNNNFYTTAIDTASDYYKFFNDFYIFSPHKKYSIDLDSYYLALEKDHKGNLVCLGTEADQEVALLELTKQERQRIIFCGTACRAEEAQWIDNNNVLIMGFSQPKNKWIPHIWLFNPGNNSLKEIKANEVQVIRKPNSYNQAVRLKHVVFKYKTQSQ